MNSTFLERKNLVLESYKKLTTAPNSVNSEFYNGCYQRYINPILTREHIPVHWRYDLDATRNPFFMERLGINAILNSGAIELDGKICLVCRVEGNDRKSFFAVCRSENGIDNFVFDEKPILLEQVEEFDVNVYDMRLVQHEDGYIYGLFCSERKDPEAGAGDTSSAVAACGIVRTKDLVNFERLPDLKTNSAQQRNVVLHPEFIDGKYAFYTRPQDGFIDAGKGGGIGFGLCDDILNPMVESEEIVDPKVYHTVKEVKNGCGATPIKTAEGFLHIAHGVRNTAAGLRYVLYMFMCDLNDPKKVIYAPGGHFLAPLGSERVGDVSNVVFSNGAVAKADGSVFIYYASSDTRMHVATSTIAQLVDWCKNTPADPLFSHLCVKQRIELIERNNIC